MKEEVPKPEEKLDDRTVQAAREILRTADERGQEQALSALEGGLRAVEEQEAAGEIGEMLQLLRDAAWNERALRAMETEKQWTVHDFFVRREALDAALRAVSVSVRTEMQNRGSDDPLLMFDVNSNVAGVVEHALGREAFLQIAPLYGMVMEDLRSKWTAAAERKDSGANSSG